MCILSVTTGSTGAPWWRAVVVQEVLTGAPEGPGGPLGPMGPWGEETTEDNIRVMADNPSLHHYTHYSNILHLALLVTFVKWTFYPLKFTEKLQKHISCFAPKLHKTQQLKTINQWNSSLAHIFLFTSFIPAFFFYSLYFCRSKVMSWTDKTGLSFLNVMLLVIMKHFILSEVSGIDSGEEY